MQLSISALRSPRGKGRVEKKRHNVMARSELAERRRVMRQVVEHLEAVYGEPRNDDPQDPLDELVETILSQSTSNVNSRRAFEHLKARFPSWEEARRARASSIERAIRGGGLARVKSVVIKNILDEIVKRNGALDLGFLRDAPLSEAMAFLTSLKGVGPKTASCVLLFACGRPLFPMDTHIFRILRRMEMIPARASDTAAHESMLALIPEGKHYSLHINLIRHGRSVCRPREPECGRCALLDFCPTGQSRW